MKRLAIAFFIIFALKSEAQNYEYSSSLPYDFGISNGEVNLTFKIESISWEETQKSVKVIDGYFMVMLGTQTPINWNQLRENPILLINQYGEEGEAFELKIYSANELIIEDMVFIDPRVAPQVLPPQIIEVPDEEEIEEDIEIDLYEEDYDEIGFASPEEDQASDEVFTIVSEMPAFPEGQAELYAYVSANIKYPDDAFKNKIEGLVYVEFIVDKTGILRDLKVRKGLGYGCDEEALRVLKSLPKFTPGKQSGELVNVRMTLPIRFKL